MFLHVLELADSRQEECALLCEANICPEPFSSHELCL